MVTATQAAGRPAEVGRGFYLGLSVLMVLVLLAGFSQTVPGDLTPPGLPLPFVAHALVFGGWVLLIILQPALVATGQIKRHRQVGLVGAGVAAAMVVMGVTATILAYPYHRVPAFFPGGVFLVMNILGILVFGGLVGTAIALRRQPDWHKRLMICATASILGPGLGRFLPMDAFGAVAPLVMFGVQDAILLIGPAADLVVRRRVHPAYLWGFAAVIFSQVAIGPLAFSPPILALVKVLRA